MSFPHWPCHFAHLRTFTIFRIESRLYKDIDIINLEKISKFLQDIFLLFVYFSTLNYAYNFID